MSVIWKMNKTKEPKFNGGSPYPRKVRAMKPTAKPIQLQDAVRLSPPHRWQADIEYRLDSGNEQTSVWFDEMEELGALIEEGPHWDTIIRCVVVPYEPLNPGLTVEAASRL